MVLCKLYKRIGSRILPGNYWDPLVSRLGSFFTQKPPTRIRPFVRNSWNALQSPRKASEFPCEIPSFHANPPKNQRSCAAPGGMSWGCSNTSSGMWRPTWLGRPSTGAGFLWFPCLNRLKLPWTKNWRPISSMTQFEPKFPTTCFLIFGSSVSCCPICKVSKKSRRVVMYQRQHKVHKAGTAFVQALGLPMVIPHNQFRTNIHQFLH